MNKKLDTKKITVFLLLIVVIVFAKFDVTIQNKWDNKVLFSASYIKCIKDSRHYIEAGFNFTPSKTMSTTNITGTYETTYEFDSYYGMSTGYYFGLLQWLRPGVHFGVGYERFKKYSNINGVKKMNGYKDWKASPYLAIGLQIGIATFIVSNEGIGGGINFVIGGRN